MKSYLIALGIFAAGAVGFVGGYGFAKKQLADETEEYISEQITQMELWKQSLTERAEKAEKRLEEQETAAVHQPNEEAEQPRNDREVYIELAERYSIEDDREYEKIYTIAPEEYQDSDYDQMEFTYYDKDDTLVDEESIPVDNTDFIADLVGDTWGRRGAKPDEVFIRNEDMSIDVSIVRVNASYSVEVLGIPEDDSDDAPRKMRAYYD